MSEQQVKMPTVEELRLLLRGVLENKRNSGGVFQDKDYKTSEFVREELLTLGRFEVYGEELRRSVLIEHGYQPPDDLKAYSSKVVEKQSGPQPNLFVPSAPTPKPDII